MSISGKNAEKSLKRIISIALYNTGIFSYGLLLHIARFLNQKADRWVRGRKNWRKQLADTGLNDQQPVWIHAASLGEFEQARPFLNAMRTAHPSAPLLVTFFSPSGFEYVQKKGLADYVFYLPLDTSTNANDFIEHVNPRFAVFVKYEFWYHFYHELARRNIPLFLVSAIFRDGQPFFRPYGYLFRELLFFADHIFVQDEQSKNLLANVGYDEVTVAGDTRFDRVVEIVENRKELPEIERFLQNNEAIVAGSTWPADEKVLASFHPQQEHNINFIVAPHEVDQKHIDQITALFGEKSITYTALLHKDEVPQHVNVLIIDNIGMLASLYQYGSLAYVGGGFDAGIHNILEAAAYGMPVIFGPNYHKFNEAKELIQAGGAITIKNSQSFETKLQWLLENDKERARAAETAYDYVHSNTGGTSIIMDHLRNKKLLPT